MAAARPAAAPQGADVLSTTEVPPAPGRLPGLGHLLPLWRAPLKTFRSLDAHGPVVRLDVAGWSVHMLTRPELVRRVLVTDTGAFTKGRMFDVIKPLFRDGLLAADGETQRRQRCLVQPAFHHHRIAACAPTMARLARELSDSWQSGQVLRVHPVMHQLTLATVADIMFTSALAPAAVDDICRAMPVLMRGILAHALTPGPLAHIPTPAKRRFTRAVTDTHHRIDEIIDAHQDNPDRPDLLSALLAARDSDTDAPMTRDQLHDEVIGIFLAGTETSGTFLAWFFHELATRPEIERRVFTEVDTVIGERPVTYERTAQLHYTARVVKEVLRQRPNLLLTYTVTRPVHLGDHLLPPGAEVGYSPYGIHHSEAFYPDPDRFDPDRWLPDRNTLPPLAFLPFSAGRTRCVGDHFGWVEMLIAIATICRRWRLRPVPGHTAKPVPAAFIEPGDLRLMATPRRAGGQ
ncbi:cytochrome P450 [Actinomycetota bacterium Odt1-20B]